MVGSPAKWKGYREILHKTASSQLIFRPDPALFLRTVQSNRTSSLITLKYSGRKLIDYFILNRLIICCDSYTNYQLIQISTISSKTSRLSEKYFSVLCIETFLTDATLSSEQLLI